MRSRALRKCRALHEARSNEHQAGAIAAGKPSAIRPSPIRRTSAANTGGFAQP